MTLASLNGSIGPAEETTIPVTDEGLLRGDGAFEVVRLYEGRPFALDDHLRRLAGSTGGLRLEVDLNAIRTEVEALLAAAPPETRNGALRIVLTRGGRRIAILEPLEAFETALSLATVTYAPTRILDNIKSLSYAANRLASRVARELGADEALLVTPHGRVLEAPTAAFFWARDGELRTPPLSDHVLDSITRRRLMAALDAREAETALADLDGAEEAFLASTTREVQAVSSIDGHALPQAPGPRTREAAAAFEGVVAAELDGA
ncbi:MAG TPA: aminotransferase class IV [Solirubrobacteraceae bacterium]